jgi:hypothetical protein
VVSCFLIEACSHARAKEKLLALFDLLARSLCCTAFILMIYMLHAMDRGVINHIQKLGNPYADTAAFAGAHWAACR